LNGEEVETMAQQEEFEMKSFPMLDKYEVFFGKDLEGYFYMIQDVTTAQIVDVKGSLTYRELMAAMGCALEPSELEAFSAQVFSLA